MVIRKPILLALLIVLATAGRAHAQDVKPTIFVGPQVRDGYFDMDAGIRDSIRDILQELRPDPSRRELPEFRIEDNRDAALLVVTVLARGIINSGSVGSSFSQNGTGFGFVMPNNVPTLTTSIQVGKYERRMQSEGPTWRTAAKAVIQDVAAWWEANRAEVAKVRQ